MYELGLVIDDMKLGTKGEENCTYGERLSCGSSVQPHVSVIPQKSALLPNALHSPDVWKYFTSGLLFITNDLNFFNCSDSEIYLSCLKILNGRNKK